MTFVDMQSALAGDEFWVAADENVLTAWPDLVANWRMPAGEGSKSLTTYGNLLRAMAQAGLKRTQTVVALGGGVAGDLVGFAAATYMRGIRFVQVPTTLLAMVDSSVGGKVGIDLPEGKNLAGAFWPPVEVRIPLDVLKTLPPRHFVNGMAEVWKYAFILDPGLMGFLNDRPLNPESPHLRTVIERCITLKAGVVERDEHDLDGTRAILNFGHTVGHAIEQATGYEPFLHGEAIAIGMVAEAKLGERLGITPPGVAKIIEQCLDGARLPTKMPDIPTETLLAAARLDKKNDSAGLGLSLLTELGQCKLVSGVAESDLESVLKP